MTNLWVVILRLRLLVYFFHLTPVGLVGLAISYALSITGLLQGMVQSFTTTEQDMVSMERAQQYIDEVPVEKTQALLQVRDWYDLTKTHHSRYIACILVRDKNRGCDELAVVGKIINHHKAVFYQSQE